MTAIPEPRRKRLERERDEASTRAAELSAQGYSLREIAEIEGIGATTALARIRRFEARGLRLQPRPRSRA